MKGKFVKTYSAVTLMLTGKPVKLSESLKKDIADIDPDYANDTWYVLKVGDGFIDIISDRYQYREENVPIDKLIIDVY